MSKLLGLSIDVDSVASHLRGYGLDGADDIASVYEHAVPRALSLLAEAHAKATFFLIAEEALRFPAIVQRIVNEGHEIGCHSMTHPLPFRLETPGAVTRELVEAKSALEQLSGKEVLGFRAPAWDLTPAALEDVARAGYVYDTSLFPSWVFLLHQRAVQRKADYLVERNQLSLSQLLTKPAVPHRASVGNGELVVIPITTTPVFRLPYYHTMRFILPDLGFQILAALAHLRRNVHYIFHAVDFLGLHEDRIDSRLRKHPGMNVSLARKISLCQSALKLLTSRGDLVPLVTIARSIV